MQLIDGAPVSSATDLVGFLACRHLFELERAALAGLVDRPVRNDPSIDVIAKRGYEHERLHLTELGAAGLSVVTVDPDGSKARTGDELRVAAAATETAMRAGTDVIYQATFFDGRWRGHADFLLRVERPSALGSWSYEVADTKLARHVKGSAILQVCMYIALLTRVQGIEPEQLHIVLGGSARTKATFRVADFMAYFRRVRTDYERAIDAGAPAYPPTATYPEPVEHCDVCRWNVACARRRRGDDDLSLVAGISARQRHALRDRGVPTRRDLAGLVLPAVPPLEGSAEALWRIREQARLQVQSEEAETTAWELLPLERDGEGVLVRDRGLLILPMPSPNDLFFDIEGDPFALDDGVEYLFGVLEPGRPDPVDAGQPRFHEIWSRDPDGSISLAAEKHAFESLVDLLIERLDADPTLHVYHYAAYERTALGRLAQRHATREEEVDRLLRGGVLIDLYRAVRQGIRAGVESYSIKKLEPLYGLRREVDLRSASSSIVSFELWLEGGMTEEGRAGEAILREIAGYNRDDVISNWRLRDWLEERRRDLEQGAGETLRRPDERPEAEQPKPLSERAAQVAALTERLTAPPAPGSAGAEDRSPDRHAQWLLAQLLSWHRREEKAFWWRFFELCGMTDEQLVDEREPLGRVALIADLGISGRGGRLQVFRFPPQDHGCRLGGAVIDPVTTRSTGSVRALDEAAGTITLHRTKSEVERGVPGSLIPDERVKTDAQEASLLEVGQGVADHGVDADGPFRAGRDLLLRRPPRAGQAPGASLRKPDETAEEAGCRLALALEATCLPIQGPPGTGKTYTGARMIVALVREGRRVGVTANSHKVIGNMLDAVRKAAAELGATVRIGQKTGPDGEPTCPVAQAFGTNGEVAAALAAGEVDVVGGTAWLWAADGLRESVDVLVVDEAGQMSLANAVAVSVAARSLVLIGDPQQLDQPVKGSHPPGAERSALGHLLGDRETIPADAGLFLDVTWRLHPDLCAFTSEVFYAGGLSSEPSLGCQEVAGAPPLDGTGIRWLPVEHEGNATHSAEEALAIRDLLAVHLAGTATWTNRHEQTAALSARDVVIVAPYNAHVDELAGALPRDVRVGTVDKFQGQEAPVSIYAMGTSSPELAPRGMDFLYSLNRLNVATSRARCLAIVVASPALLRVECRTPGQMRLANALCRLVELAGEPAWPAAPGGAPARPTTE